MRWTTPTSLLAAASLALAPLAGCTGDSPSRPPPAVDDTASARPYDRPAGRTPETTRPRMSSTTKKMIVLGGAAALYYLYKQHKNAPAQAGPEGQYYLSKNGRVYYRDAEHRAHWVTPPPGGITVPAEEADQYREFQGYDNRPTGRDLRGLGDAPDTY